MSKEVFQVKPIGGLGRIGANMTLIKNGDRSIVIDTGILFPKDDNYGINFLIPDFYSILSNKNIDGLIITHGHEDHIGAILFVINHIPNLTIYAPRFAARLIRKKTSEAKVSVKVVEYDKNSELDFETFVIKPFPVNHSIPDTFGIVAIDKLKKFSLGFFSDFKIDLKTTYERPFDIEALNLLMNSAQNKLLLTDSTNVLSKSEPTSEIDLVEGLEKIISNAKSRVFITCFSSNIFRIQSIINAAAKNKRLVVPFGKSMAFYSHTAMELGLLKDEKGVLRDVASVDPQSDRLIILLSGCQGEFKGTMRRVALEEDTTFKLNDRDTFMFSSKTIPGNEVNISIVMNALAAQNVQIVTSTQEKIHASGHATASELCSLYQTIRPNYIIPIHGETYLLQEHIKLIKTIPGIKPVFVTNGDTVTLNKDGGLNHQVGEESDPLIIQGSDTVLDKQAISQRRKMAETGVVFLSIKHESIAKKRPVFSVSHMGLPQTAIDLIPDFEEFLQGLLKCITIKSKEVALEEVRVASRRYFIPKTGLRPIAIVQFV